MRIFQLHGAILSFDTLTAGHNVLRDVSISQLVGCDPNVGRGAV